MVDYQSQVEDSIVEQLKRLIDEYGSDRVDLDMLVDRAQEEYDADEQERLDEEQEEEDAANEEADEVED